MKNMALTVIPLIMLVLSGCKDKVYDVSYYSSHIDKAKEVAQQCETGEVTDDNCKNANKAIYKEKRKEVMHSIFR